MGDFPGQLGGWPGEWESFRVPSTGEMGEKPGVIHSCLYPSVLADRV